MVFPDRSETKTWRVSPLFARIVASGAARCGVSEGDYVEQLGRAFGPRVGRQDFPIVDEAST